MSRRPADHGARMFAGDFNTLAPVGRPHIAPTFRGPQPVGTLHLAPTYRGPQPLGPPEIEDAVPSNRAYQA